MNIFLDKIRPTSREQICICPNYSIYSNSACIQNYIQSLYVFIYPKSIYQKFGMYPKFWIIQEIFWCKPKFRYLISTLALSSSISFHASLIQALNDDFPHADIPHDLFLHRHQTSGDPLSYRFYLQHPWRRKPQNAKLHYMLLPTKGRNGLKED